jgi:glycosyltransferase involved in cell wall biosynthesis
MTTRLPRITLITPSFNQASFLEATIRSVLDQGYPDLQYGVIDGGSTDGSVEILERYRGHLSFLVIEQDRGQTEAINKGLRRADGDVVGWLCSDDLLPPGSLQRIGEAFADSACDWAAGAVEVIEADGTPVQVQRPTGDFSLAGVLLRGEDRPFCLPQPGVFWRRRLHDELGPLREDLHYCMDFEWWLRLVASGRRPVLLDQTLARYRLHEASKSVALGRGFRREHLLVESAYADRLSWRDRLRLYRRCGYLRRALALSEPGANPWRLVARRPWWIMSQQVRAALAA